MKQHNYKAGDKVRIIGNKCLSLPVPFHGYDNGDIVTVEHVCFDGDLICKRVRDGKTNRVYQEHVELVEADKPAIFNRDDIKAGYLLEVKREGEDKPFYMTVGPANYDEPDGLGCCCPGKEWWPLNCFDKDTLVYKGPVNTFTILRVYSLTTNMRLLDNTTEGRGLLWVRQEKPKAVKMTVAEISEKLGYDVEIVKEKAN